MNATIAAALAVAGFVLLVPTFNALNTASFEPRPPPFDLNPPPPEELPEEMPPPGDTELPVELPPTPPPEDPCPDPTPVPESAYTATFQGPGLILDGGQGDSAAVAVETRHVAIVVSAQFREYVGSLSLDLAGPGDARYEWRPATTGPDAQNGAWSDRVDAPATGEWTITWRASPVAGGGGLDVSLVHIECGEAEP